MTALSMSSFDRVPVAAAQRPSRRIAVVGPVAPFSSGIARHTTCVARALAADDAMQLGVFSFSRQYPRLLYPGGDQQGGMPDPLIEANVHRTIDSVNPMTWNRSARMIAEWRPDLVIMPAWTFFVAPCLGHIAGKLRRTGAEIAMIVHNAEDHEAHGIKGALLRRQMRHASRVLTHNEELARQIRETAPHLPTIVHPHPPYDDFPPAKGLLPRRAALELLFFGLVRPYKGLDVLLEALALCRDMDVRLTVAGEFWGTLAETEATIDRLSLRESVELIPGYVDDATASELFDRADAIVAPYRSASGSGVLAMADFFGKPVVASDLPAFQEALNQGTAGWLFESENPQSLANRLRECAANGPHTVGRRSQAGTGGWAAYADALLGQSGKDPAVRHG